MKLEADRETLTCAVFVIFESSAFTQEFNWRSVDRTCRRGHLFWKTHWKRRLLNRSLNREERCDQHAGGPDERMQRISINCLCRYRRTKLCEALAASGSAGPSGICGTASVMLSSVVNERGLDLAVGSPRFTVRSIIRQLADQIVAESQPAEFASRPAHSEVYLYWCRCRLKSFPLREPSTKSLSLARTYFLPACERKFCCAETWLQSTSARDPARGAREGARSSPPKT